jgi:hypothetical protein
MAKVWSVLLPVHVIADTAEEAMEIFGPIVDDGAVRITLTRLPHVYVDAIHANYPDCHAPEHVYDTKEPEGENA